MNERICRVCKAIFVTQSLFILICSDQCRYISTKRSNEKYKRTPKGLAAKERWQKNPKRKEIHKRHMQTSKGKASAVKRISRLINENPYYRQTKRLRESKAYRELRNEMIAKFEMCACCHSEDDLTLDHIQPLSLGGEHKIENLQVLCRSCNARKKQETIRYELPKMQH